MLPTQVSMWCYGKIPIAQPLLSRQDFLHGFNIAGYDTWNLHDIQVKANQLFKVIGVGVSFTVNFDLPDHDQILAA